MRIVGIDPGTHKVGYALVEHGGPTPALLRAETIVVARASSPADRLATLARALASRLRRDRPAAVATERLTFGKNRKTALAVAEARGIILLTAHRFVPSIWEYTPLELKLAVTGYGRAEKSGVRRMVHLAFPTHTLPQEDDAIDAIALALAAGTRRRPDNEHPPKGRKYSS